MLVQRSSYYGLKWTDKDVFELGKVVDLGVLADRVMASRALRRSSSASTRLVTMG